MSTVPPTCCLNLLFVRVSQSQESCLKGAAAAHLTPPADGLLFCISKKTSKAVPKSYYEHFQSCRPLKYKEVRIWCFYIVISIKSEYS